jgi:hypothetical protein
MSAWRKGGFLKPGKNFGMRKFRNMKEKAEGIYYKQTFITGDTFKKMQILYDINFFIA